MRRELKQLGTAIEYSENAPVTLSLPRIHPTRKFQLRLKLSIANTTLATGQTYGTAVTDSPANIIQRIDLRVVGAGKSQNIKSLSARDILKHAQFNIKGLQENVDNCPSGTTSVSAGTTISYGSYDLDFSIPESADLGVLTNDPNTGVRLDKPLHYKPKDQTILDPRLYDPVELVITWGSLSSIRTGSTAGVLTITAASTEITVWSEDAPENIGGPWINREIYKEETWTGANTDLRIDLPEGNLIRKIMIRVDDNGTLSNSACNTVKVVKDENIEMMNIGFNALRNENAKQYGIPYTSLLAGYAIIDFDTDKDLQGVLDVRAVQSIRLSLDVNASTAGVIRVLVQELTGR